MVTERRDNDREVEEYHVQEREVQKTVRFRCPDGDPILTTNDPDGAAHKAEPARVK